MRFFHVAFALLISSPPSFGGPLDLLEPVDESELAQARGASDWFINDYFIEQETYFASRYRIVTVNVGVLLDLQEIEIDLFDGQSVRLRVSAVDVHPTRSSIGWTGYFVDPEITIEDLRNAGLPESDVRALAKATNSLIIGVGEISYNASTRRKYTWYDARFARHASATRAYSDDGQSRVYDVSFYMHHSKLPGIYELRPPETTPLSSAATLSE